MLRDGEHRDAALPRPPVLRDGELRSAALPRAAEGREALCAGASRGSEVVVIADHALVGTKRRSEEGHF